MILHLSSLKAYRDVCYLFHRENLASPYDFSNVELICSAGVKRKHFVSARSTTWMVSGHMTERVDSI